MRDTEKGEKTLRQALLERNNRELLLLTDENGHEHHYRQIATIKMRGELFCILRPFGSVCKKNEAMLFKYEGEGELCVQTDKALIKEIFDAYRACK